MPLSINEKYLLRTEKIIDELGKKRALTFLL
jgi:hypothetical protein